MQPAHTSAKRRLAVRTAGTVLGIAVIVLIVRALRRDGPAALEAWRTADVQWEWVALATASALAGQVIGVFGWKRLLTDMGIAPTFTHVAKMFLVSNLGRYLPGAKAWQMGVVGVMAAEAGMSGPIVAGTSLLQGVIGVAVGMILLFVFGGAALGVAPVWFVLPAVGVGAVLAGPAVLRLFPRTRAVVASRVPGADTVSVATMWTLVWASAVTWLAWGFALYALARALLGDPGASVVTYIAAWIGPFLAGVVAVITPAGLGVRDGVMQGMLHSAGVQSGAAVMVVAVSRVWATLVEVFPAIVVLALRPRNPPPAT